ncbi:hypothetical protein T12_6065 [Trichinella patagoniensis]|uniref:Uncharacterized protein n=1 Tax=Trichinella patagoniensis TaxID=990121 RepID=A0A0V0ZUW2_9BILA|nr:hypothetical protein T12_6065 [Trichinella patagoniensis]
MPTTILPSSFPDLQLLRVGLRLLHFGTPPIFLQFTGRLQITKMRKKNKATVSRPVLEDQEGCEYVTNKAWKRGGRAGSNRTDDTDAEMSPQIDTGASSFGNDRGSNPVEARNEPARESGSLHQ